MYNSKEFLDASIDQVTETLLIAFGLVFLMVFYIPAGFSFYSLFRLLPYLLPLSEHFSFCRYLVLHLTCLLYLHWFGNWYCGG